MTRSAGRAYYPPPPLAARSPSASRRHGWMAVLVVGAVLLALAVTLHALWDSRTSLVGTAVVAVVGLVALGWTVHRTAHIGRPAHHTAHDPAHCALRYSRTVR